MPITRAFITLLLSSLLCGQALAAEGRVLRIEGPRCFVDLGASDGLRAGDTVELMRTVELFDPDQGRALRDRFSVGTGRIVEVGTVLTLLALDPAVAERLVVGDVVIAPEHTPPPAPVVQSPDAPATPATPAAPDASLLAAHSTFVEAFAQAATETSLPRRRAVWERFLATEPEDAVRAVVQQELAALAVLEARAAEEVPAPRRAVVAAQPTAPAEPAGPPPLVAIPAAVSRTHAHHEVQVAVTVPQIHRVARAELFYKRGGSQTWQQATLRPLGDTVLGASIPVSVVDEPSVDWYVEIVEHDGQQTRLPAGSGHRSVQVLREPGAPEIRDRSQVSLSYEFADFYQMKGQDWFSIFEADFLYRVGAGPLHSLRLGYGVYDGVSGPVEQLDDPAVDPSAVIEDVGYKFGVAEVELDLAPGFAVLPRGIVGVQIDGLAMGLGGKLRIGQEEGTSLLVGGLHLGDVGQLYQLQLAWNTVPRVPMAAEVSVTNQPGVSLTDYGVRFAYEARYEVTDWLQVGGRVGYQLRNIFHNGPGFGGTVVFGW